MRVRTRVGRLALALIVSCLVATGCGDDELTPSETVQLLADFTVDGPSGNSAPLSTFTSYEWDTVYYFVELTDRADAEAVVGQELDVDESNRWAYLVFTRDGEVVQIEEALPPLTLSGDSGASFSYDDAMIEVATADPGPYSTSQITSK